MNTGPNGKNLKKPNFLLKKRSIVNLLWWGSKTKIMNMPEKFGKSLEVKTKVISRFVLKIGCNSIGKCLRSF